MGAHAAGIRRRANRGRIRHRRQVSAVRSSETGADRQSRGHRLRRPQPGRLRCQKTPFARRLTGFDADIAKSSARSCRKPWPIPPKSTTKSARCSRRWEANPSRLSGEKPGATGQRSRPVRRSGRRRLPASHWPTPLRFAGQCHPTLAKCHPQPPVSSGPLLSQLRAQLAIEFADVDTAVDHLTACRRSESSWAM